MIERLLREKHGNDADQLEFIFSDDKHISVIAPAGCGKTTAMVSKIARELSCHKIDVGKKILAMTFSVAGAMKINDSLKDLLPEFTQNIESYLGKIDVANYHSFSMRILYKYGFVLNEAFLQLQSFRICNEDDASTIAMLSSSESEVLSAFVKALNESDVTSIDSLSASYWDILNTKLLPRHVITYNGILLAAIELLKVRSISAFYSKYYQLIIIDEFQDTNYLGYLLTNLLINDNRSIFLGDGMQKIYSFIGALPDAFLLAKDTLDAKEIRFKQNYRFTKNESLMQLDHFLRRYGEEDLHLELEEAVLKCNVFQSDEAENNSIIKGIKKIISSNEGAVAVLVRAGYQGMVLSKMLEAEGIDYFNSLYRDTDPEYIRFYNVAIREFHSATDGKHKAVVRDLKRCLTSVKSRESEIILEPSKKYIFDSLYALLEILFEQSKMWRGTPTDRYENIDFVLGTNGLKHMAEYLDTKVFLSTVHSAKGLEWEFVIVPYMNSYSFPASAVCKKCKEQNDAVQGQKYCIHNFSDGSKSLFLDELSVFYVAMTRAKNQLFVTANTGKNAWGFYKCTSCFLNLEGLQLESYKW